jgi:ribosomal protein S12 methylthiotransferase
VTVLVDEPGVARSSREAPEIDGIVELPSTLEVGTFQRVRIVHTMGPDSVAEPV